MNLKKSEFEFISLIAVMTSLGALSIDAVLPALSSISKGFGLHQSNTVQQVVGLLFLGMTIGQLAYGPLSDKYGRRPILFIGMAIFAAGSLLSIHADNFTVMLAGRFIQGLGVAALRIVPMAIIRDGYEGAAMARIMSLTMALFIIVPCFSPLLGQAILSVSSWQGIFWFLLLMVFVAAVWVWLRQPETLPPERRNSGGIKAVKAGMLSILSNRITRNYTISIGLIMGSFMGYIMCAEQIFRDIFLVGDLFSLYFGLTAVSIGIASVVNARLVQSFSPEKVCHSALYALIIVSGLGMTVNLIIPLSLVGFLLVISITFFFIGLLIGNMNAIAMQPLGHIAGLANSAISFISGCIAMVIGSALGMAFNMSVQPLLLGLFITSLLSILILSRTTYPKNIIDTPVS